MRKMVQADNEIVNTDSGYWSKLVRDAGSYVRFYNIRSLNYGARKLRVRPEAVSAFSEKENCSPFEFYGSVFALYLARINRRRGCLLATALPEEPGLPERNTLLKIDVKEEDCFGDLIRGFRRAYAEASEHTKTDVEKSLDEKATYYGIYDLSALSVSEDGEKKRGEGSALTLCISGDSAELVYHADLFSEVYIDHMVKNLESTLESVLNSPEQVLSGIDILSKQERELLSAYSRGKDTEVDPDRLFSAAFRDHAKASPDAVAVDDGRVKICYSELERSSNSVAKDLYENHGIRPGSRVALMLPRNWHFAEMMLALNKLGAAYVPIDLRFPVNRIGHMLRVSEAEYIVVSGEVGETPELPVKRIFLEDLDRTGEAETEILTKKEDVFAILFTSGTTGIPKGVIYSNRQAPWGVAALMDMFHFKEGDVIGSYFSFSFVASYVMVVALYAGCTLRLFNEEEQKNSLLLVKALKEEHMNSLILPPAVGIPLYESEDLKLDYLLLAGAKLNELSRTRRHTKLINAYGTSEVVFAISKIYDLSDSRDRRVPLGRPVANTRAYILDDEGRPMPIGVPGEICISGGICSPGYCNDPELTARCFVPNPFADSDINKTMYHTGDIGFYNFDGEVEIIGREDDQLSVRGFRIEASEILRIMRSFPEITDLCPDVENDNLVVYYTGSDELDINRVKEALQAELPYYMIPSLFVRLEKIPLNINGKIDKARIRKEVRHEDMEIADEVLCAVVEAFREVLAQDTVFVDDDFVALGGNSLSAMKLQLALHEKLDVSLSSNELIGLSTPKEIADHIRFDLHVHAAVDEDRYTFDTPCPLSESQLNVYLDESVHDMGTAYNNPFMLKMKAGTGFSADEIRSAIGKLFETFPVLTARVCSRDGELNLMFDAEPEIREGSAEDVKDFVQRFDVEKSLCRFLIAEEGDTTALCADFHHLIFDGTSLNVLLSGFLSALRGEASDYVDRGILREAAFEELIRNEGMDTARAFFDEMLADRDEVYGLIPSVDGDDSHETIRSFAVDPEALEAFLKNHALTGNQFFAGVFAYTLSRFSGSEKVLFSLIEDGRGHFDLSRSVGMFVKTLPVLMDCKDQETDAFLRYAAGQINSVMKYDMYPFRLLAGRYDLDAGIQFQYSHDIFLNALHRDELDYEIEECRHDINADFLFNILNGGDNSLTVRILHTSRYSKDFAEHFAEAYENILRGMMKEEKLGEISYISGGDEEILDGYNQTDVPIEYSDILEAFNATLSKYPENRLVEFGKVSHTFAEGAFLADRIRQKLEALDVKQDDRVGFLVPRSELYVLSVLGIMSLGAAYVPLDDNLPDERVGFMLRDAGAKVLIVSDGTRERAEKILKDFPEGEAPVLLDISDIVKAGAGRLEQLPVKNGRLACILYTSGSTGIPKGVKITRESLKYFVFSHVKSLDILPGDVYAMYASIGFDVSMAAMFSAMYSGACVDVIPDCIKLDIRALDRHFREHHVTHSYITTQIAKLFLRQVEKSTLKVLVAGGEKLGEVTETRHYRIVDAYGPTEACVYVIAADTTDKIDYSSVGKVLNNTKAYILDSEKRRVPIGAVGGLYLSGPHLAEGYLNREEETARAFTRNPFEENEKYGRMYYTGDVARILPDGTYGIVGRRDGQVKIRGNRVELSEVEAIIRKVDNVKDVTTRIINRNGNNELVAYVVSSEQDEKAVGEAVSGYMTGRVPCYMVPSYVVRMDSIPLNVNGKVDKRSLPEVDFSQLQSDYAAPRNELEQQIVSGFEKVFGMDRISIYDDFVRLGGDSLTAVKLLSHINREGITVGMILSLRTPEAIAAGVQSVPMDLELYTLETGCPLNNTQQYMFTDIERRQKYDSYLIPSIIPVDRKYSDEQIMDALDKIFTAHPVLTTRVEVRDGVPYLVQGEKPEIMKGSINLVKVLNRLTSDFDIYEGMTRQMIVRVFGKCYLVSVFHHMIFDVMSNNVFRSSFLKALEGEAPDRVDDDFLKIAAFHQQIQGTEQFAEETKFLRAMFERLDEVGFYRNSGKHGKPGYVLEDLGVSREQVEAFASKAKISKNLLFTAALARALSGLTEKDDVFFAFVENGRDRFRNYDAMGLFINTMPIIAHVDRRDQKKFLSDLSELYYDLTKNNFYPFGPLSQEYNVFPVLLFQFLPEWIIADGEYDDLPLNETLINMALSRLSDFLVEALTEVVEKKDGYAIRIFYSGYYSRKMIKALVEAYITALHEIMSRE